MGAGECGQRGAGGAGGRWGARARIAFSTRGATHLYASEVPGREIHHTLPQAGHVPLQCLKHGAIGACAMGAQAPGKDLPVGRGNKTTAHFHGISLKNTASLCQNHAPRPAAPHPAPFFPRSAILRLDGEQHGLYREVIFVGGEGHFTTQ